MMTMMTMADRSFTAALLAAAALAMATSAPPLAAQQPAPAATSTRVPNPGYGTAFGGEEFAGRNWRQLWVRPLSLPVLDIGRFAGGLKPQERGGGNQSITLHFVDARGREWVFRSLDKYPEQSLPPDLTHTFVQKVVEDQVSALHPGGAFVVPRLLDALGILHVTPRLYLMPDDPRLGEFRSTFANMIGLLEEQAQEGPHDTPGFAGSRKVKSTDGLFADLEESPDYRLDDGEFLRARVFDILINDTDRATDNWRWARFGTEGHYVYRPVPRDRDWAFVNGHGLIALATRAFMPKHTSFGPELPSVEAITFSSYVLDRRLLTRLTRVDFERAVAEVQARLADAVIAQAVRDLPPSMQPGHADQLAADLRARRDALRPTVMKWYAWLSTEPDIQATDAADAADIEHLANGTLRVRLARLAGGAPYYERVFLPNETNEVRVFLHGGNDRALVHGRPGSIGVRVIGGGDDDTLEDRAGGAHFYDEKGDNRYVRARGTTVSGKPWYQPDPPQGLRFGLEWAPDWGRDTGYRPRLAIQEGAGLVVGASHGIRKRGFRRLPHAWDLELSALYATGSGGFGLEARYDARFENSRLGLAADARATRFEAFRFNGLGNDSPDLGKAVSLIMQDQARLFAGLSYRFGPLPGQHPRGTPTDQPESAAGQAGGGVAAKAEEGTSAKPFATDRARALAGRLVIGPVAQWTRPHPPDLNPLHDTSLASPDGYGMLGAGAELELQRTDRPAAPRRGFTLRAEANGFPALWDVRGGFGNAALTGAAYVPVLGPTHLAVRVGGERVFGDFPAFESAFIGGRRSLRGYRFDRFAGDASAFGSAELRVPLDTVRIVLNGELGVFGLADAGRVWLDGASPGGWHSAAGGGVWFATMNTAVSLSYARGNQHRFYAAFGLPF